jgi:hypothetical protein
MTTEINVRDHQSTVVIHEYVDRLNGLARIDTHISGKMTSLIMDFEANLEYEIVDTDNSNFMQPDYDPKEDTCIKNKGLDAGTSRGDKMIHNLFFDRKTTKMKSVADMFELDPTIKPEYVGKKNVRGIDADMWRTSSVPGTKMFDGHRMVTTSDIEHYFATSGWSMGQSDTWAETSSTTFHRVPLKIHQRISAQNTSTGEVTNHVINYNVVGFWAGMPDHSLFHPGKMICTGPISEATQPRLPKLPEMVHMVVEANILEKGYSTYLEETYDSRKNRARFYQKRSNGDRILELDFYNTDTQLQVINDTICVANTIAENTDGHGFRLSSKTKSHHISGSADIFQFNNDGAPEVYMGQVRARGIPCDKVGHVFM